jgi:murein L,D-transpeptidase YafK
MKAKLLTLLLLTSTFQLMAQKNFFKSQLNFPRVKKANLNKAKDIDKLLSSNGISTTKFDLFLRAFKTEGTLEVWAKNKSDKTYKLVKTYKHCAKSGVLGPKRRSGDKQTPEGFYEVDLFNPTSNYHLSFRINYPNASDKVLSDQLNPGDNIFIHGDCITIGCIPIGDDLIEELYIFAARGYSNGKIPVHVFPITMTSENLTKVNAEFPQHVDFWKQLKLGYDAFEKSKQLPNVSVEKTGKYIIN